MVTRLRKDCWTEVEDELLVSVVIKHIQSGSTQLKAFEEVGKQLTRTASACGFRWNSYLRKKHKDQIVKAKKERKKMLYPCQTTEQTYKYSFNDVLNYLEELFYHADKNRLLLKDKELSQEKISHLEKQIRYLKANNRSLEEKNKKIEEDFQSVLGYLESARKIALLKNEPPTTKNEIT